MIPLEAIPVVGKLFDKLIGLIPDPQKKVELQLEYEKLAAGKESKLLDVLSSIDIKQAEINLEEAKSSSLFISGARPFIMWVCGAAFTWAFVLQPIVTYILTTTGHPVTGLPNLNMGELMPVLLGVLGLGGLRSFEKIRGVQDKH